ncbi:MAG: hypothetical protein WA892_09925 [Ornithinimicrobium sp.]
MLGKLPGPEVFPQSMSIRQRRGVSITLGFSPEGVDDVGLEESSIRRAQLRQVRQDMAKRLQLVGKKEALGSHSLVIHRQVIHPEPLNDRAVGLGGGLQLVALMARTTPDQRQRYKSMTLTCQVGLT